MSETATAKDYAVMTDEQLNREVAERQGWKQRPDREYDVLYETPDGHVVSILDHEVATDLNAAAALDFRDHVVQIDRHPRDTVVKVLKENGGIMIYEHHASEARARTIAWLLFMDAIA